MILVTGGSGFIGSHTVRALTALGESCVVIQRSSADVPPQLDVIAEQGDITDLETLRAIGTRHEITGIVHLAGYPDPRSTGNGVEPTADLLHGFLNIVRVAGEWNVRRLTLASTIGVYAGIEYDGALREDLPLHLSAPHPVPRWKKITELLGEQLAEATGVEIVTMRISGTWGPTGHEDPFFAAPALAHAAASGTPLDTSGMIVPPHLRDGLDLCYVKDTGRAIAQLQLADHLNHRTYNVASGRITTNADIIEAIRLIEPGFHAELADVVAPQAHPLDITRLQNDTGFRPEYSTAAAVADYVAWLRAGNVR